MKRFLCALMLAFVSVGTCLPEAMADRRMRVGSYHVPVLLRPNAGALLTFPVYSNPNPRVRGVTVVAVPGLSHTAASFRPLAEHIFADHRYRNRVERVVVIEFPGKGRSTIPMPPHHLRFGEMTLDDYARIFISGLKAIDRRTREPIVVIAHSMGGMIAQLAEQRLEASNSSLRQKFNVQSVMLVAPTLPRETPWLLSDSGVFGQVTSQYVAQTPLLGAHLSFPPEIWFGLFFADRLGQPVANPAEVLGFRANESLFAAAELGGVAVPRPSVAANIFGNDGSSFLSVVSLEQDGLYVFPSEHETLRQHLGGGSGTLYAIGGPLTVHDSYIVAPSILEPALNFHLNR